MADTLALKLKHSIQTSQRSALIELLRSHPETTIYELLRWRGEMAKLVRSVAIGELVAPGGSATPNRTLRDSPARRSVAADSSRDHLGGRHHRLPTAEGIPGRARGEGQEIAMRTPADRSRYDASLFMALKGAGEPLSTLELVERVGGTPLQMRAALARLIKSRKVVQRGRKRGTKYQAR